MFKSRLFIFVAVLSIISFTFSKKAVCAESSNSRRTPIVGVYEKTHNSVVNISGTRVITTSYSSGFGFPDIFDSMLGPRMKQEVSVLGSGVVVHEDGYVMIIRKPGKDSEIVSSKRRHSRGKLCGPGFIKNTSR